MKYLDLLTKVKKSGLYVFSVNDIVKCFPDSAYKTIHNQLQLWTRKGLLTRLIRGFYSIKFPEGGPVFPDFYIANRIYEPSYVSLETALSFYSLIPEVAFQVTSVTTRQTKLFKNKLGGFSYSSCKKEVFGGYKIILFDNFKVLIAEREKALVDYIYFKRRHGIKIDFESERFDMESIKKLSWEKVHNYARMCNLKTLSTVESLWKSIK